MTKEPAGGPITVQIFGIHKSADTRAALRFFAERRITTHFVDLDVKAASLGELRRFAQKFGVAALVDTGGKRYADLGLRRAILTDQRWLEKLTQEPRLLRLPLVRCENRVTVGAAAATWKAWVAR